MLAPVFIQQSVPSEIGVSVFLNRVQCLVRLEKIGLEAKYFVSGPERDVPGGLIMTSPHGLCWTFPPFPFGMYVSTTLTGLTICVPTISLCAIDVSPRMDTPNKGAFILPVLFLTLVLSLRFSVTPYRHSAEQSHICTLP